MVIVIVTVIIIAMVTVIVLMMMTARELGLGGGIVLGCCLYTQVCMGQHVLTIREIQLEDYMHSVLTRDP